ncbi:hypothetical protein P879_11617 [Paragonimus westermani]|uniref:Uncharacterized protein n=1 Tax=Paragonimus westermani TaxID=34504 RepID=A0A8T0DCD1_9TREM|nr:hypothetical protein P879_11617 [Paragonimus westermani]
MSLSTGYTPIKSLLFLTQSILTADFGVFCTWTLQSVRIKLV